MSNKFQVIVIGGGNAGLAVTAQLLKKDPTLSIAIMEPSEKHYYQPAWTLVGAGEFDIIETEKNEIDYIPKASHWIKDAAATFDPDNNSVTTFKGDTYFYEVLIVVPGIQIDWGKIKGLKETLGKQSVSSNYSFEHAPYTWEMVKNFNGGVAVFTNPASPIKCGGAPHKAMYLACDYWRKKGILDKCEVHYISGAGAIFGVKEYAHTLEGVLKMNKIKTHFLSNVIEIDGTHKIVYYESKGADGNVVKHEMKFDLCHAVPPQSAPDFIKKSVLSDKNNPYGYVEVDKHTFRHMKYPNVFAFGDVSNAPCSKTGAAIRKQTPVVVDHVLATLKNTTSQASYDGYSACPIPTQYGKLMLAEFDYSGKPTMTFPFDQTKPSRLMWILKKYILPWLYWSKILPGKA